MGREGSSMRRKLWEPQEQQLDLQPVLCVQTPSCFSGMMRLCEEQTLWSDPLLEPQDHRCYR